MNKTILYGELLLHVRSATRIMESGWYDTGYGYRDTNGKKEKVIRCQKFVRNENGEVYTLTKLFTEESLNEIQEEYSKRKRGRKDSV